MKFLDQAKIYIRSGNGGAGCVSFRREKFIEFGGPDGGNGGRGGDVVAECVDGLNTLIDYRYQQHFKAKTGVHGMGKNRTGANGASAVLKVPATTTTTAAIATGKSLSRHLFSRSLSRPTRGSEPDYASASRFPPRNRWFTRPAGGQP